MMASAFFGGASRPANAARSKTQATIAHSARELDAAIDLFARFTPELLKPNKPATVDGHRIKPAFSPLHFVREGSEGDFLTHLVGSLVSGEMDELQMSLDVGYDPTFSLPAHTLTSLKNAIDTES